MLNTPLGQVVCALVVASFVFLAAPQSLRADPLTMTFVNENTTYASSDEAWFLFSYTGSSPNEFVATVLGTGPNSGPMVFSAGAGPSAGSYFSPVYSIADLSEGIEVSQAASTRIYVSLGRPLDPVADPTTPDNPFSSFGIPSSTAGAADPNWNVRWDFFETTLSNPRSADDYGDLSVINQFAIPLQIDVYDSATEQTPANLLQSAQSASFPDSLRENLTALANANLSNNNFATLPGNWFIETPTTPSPSNPYPGSFLRQVGPASGGTDPEWIGPFPSMNPYAEFVANAGGAPITTSLTGSTAVAQAFLQKYDMTTTASFSSSVPHELIGIQVSGTVETAAWDATPPGHFPTPVPDGKTYMMQIALDSDVGLTTADYPLSNALYGSAWQDNTGITYWIDSGMGFVSYTRDDFLAAVSSNGTMALQTVNLWMQNLFVGYNFGLVGNTQTVSNLPTGHGLTNVTLNDMGSAGWTELKILIDTGQLATADVPFFSLTDSQNRPLYNQWAAGVFASSQTSYGMQYSDMFQPLLALYTYQSPFIDNVYQSTSQDVLSWKVTIRADVPEVGPVGSLVAVGTLLAMRRVRVRQQGRGARRYVPQNVT